MPEPFASHFLSTLPTRISDVVKPWAERSPDHPALIEASGTWTYQQLNSTVSRTQVWLGAVGVRPGDRVGMLHSSAAC